MASSSSFQNEDETHGRGGLGERGGTDLVRNDAPNDQAPASAGDSRNLHRQHRPEHHPDRQIHLKTYTAGEDKSRLQQAAKALGLQRARSPRRQVRSRARGAGRAAGTRGSRPPSRGHHHYAWHLLLDPTTEQAQIRSVYSQHGRPSLSRQDFELLRWRYDLQGYDDDGLYQSSGRYSADERADDYLFEDVQEAPEVWFPGDLLPPRRAGLDAVAPGEDGTMPSEEDEDVLGGDLTFAVMGIIKGMVGPAILYLPHGFAASGYAMALPLLFVATALFLYSSSCLLQSWRIEQDKYENEFYRQQQQLQGVRQQPDDYHATSQGLDEDAPLLANNGQKGHDGSGEAGTTTADDLLPPRVLLSYPELAYRALGTRGEFLVRLGIALMQSGVCLTYLIFVPQNLHASMLTLTGLSISPSTWLILMVAIQIPLSWIRDIRKLSPTNLLANVLIFYGLCVCLGFAVIQATQPRGSSTGEWTVDRTSSNSSSAELTPDAPVDVSDPFSSWVNIYDHWMTLYPYAKDWYLFIGTSVLLFEGSITLLVPLQEAIDTPEQRARFPRVYQRVILSIIAFYTFFATTCWMAFGNHVNVVLTTSLPAGILATTVQLAYSLAVIFTFPLQNFPALEITCRAVASVLERKSPTFDYVDDGGRPTNKEAALSRRNLISGVMVLLLAMVALCTLNSLDKVVSLMGSLLGCPIAFVFPPLIQSQLAGDQLSKFRLWGNRLVALAGLVAMVMASVSTLITWR